MPKGRNFIKDVLYTIGFGLLIIYILFLFGGPYESDILGIDNVYEVVEDKNVLIDVSDCRLPKQELGIRCCLIDEEIPMMCLDEAKDFEKKIEESNDYTGDSGNEYVYLRSLDMKFLEPPNYFIVKDFKMGGMNNPYFYISSNEEGGYVTIVIQDKTELLGNDGFSIKEDIKAFQGSFQEGVDIAVKSLGGTILEKESRIISTKKGYEAIVHEQKYSLEGEVIYSKNAIFMDHPVLLVFESTNEYVDYVYEFDDLLNSVIFY